MTKAEDIKPEEGATAEEIREAAVMGAATGEELPADTEETTPDVSPEDTLEGQIAVLTAERDELRDRLMRALAEAENARKRGERDRKDAELYGGTKLARDVLDVYDHLGLALQNVDETQREAAGALIEGVELTRRSLIDSFAKHKIEKIEPEVGEKFDPKWHQAMFEAPVPNAEAGTVIQVMKEGFRINDRLLRAAMVGVAAKQG